MGEEGRLSASVDAERRLIEIDAFVTEYEAAHGEITAEEMDEAARRARCRAVVVRPGPQSG